MVSGGLVIISEAVGATPCQPHSDPPRICREVPFDHFPPVFLIILSGKPDAQALFSLSRSSHGPPAGLQILLQPIIETVSAHALLHSGQRLTIILRRLPEIPLSEKIRPHGRLGSRIMIVHHIRPAEHLHGPQRISSGFLQLFQLDAGTGKICTGHSRLICRIFPLHNGERLLQTPLGLSKIPHLLI